MERAKYLRDQPFVAAVLAGGRSSRMGKCKASLRFNGMSLLDHMLQLLSELEPTSVLLSGSIEGYDCVDDYFKELGPVSGVFSLMQSSWICYQRPFRLLVCAVDQILLEREQLQALESFDLLSSSLLHYASHPLPFIATVDQALICRTKRELTQASGGKGPSLSDFFSWSDSHPILPSNPALDSMLKGVNTQEDWQQFLDEQ